MNDPLGIQGRTLEGKYQVLEPIGEGGFATVYRALHLIWKRPVAIKFFGGLSQALPELRDALLRDFIAEGALLTELSSETASIVQARDVGELKLDEGRWMPYIVLEWLEGRNLESLLEERAREGRARFSVTAALNLLHPICQALEVAHQRGVAHRDIKPANLFVVAGDPDSAPPTIKILDFGVAKVVADRQKFSVASAETGQGVQSFTPQYGAPEQFSRSFGATGPWTDVYALALLGVDFGDAVVRPLQRRRLGRAPGPRDGDRARHSRRRLQWHLSRLVAPLLPLQDGARCSELGYRVPLRGRAGGRRGFEHSRRRRDPVSQALAR